MQPRRLSLYRKPAGCGVKIEDGGWKIEDRKQEGRLFSSSIFVLRFSILDY
jgi:hypothetical protein